MAPEPNLRVLRPSRKPPRPGDVFAMLPPGGQYLFGRVIATDASAGAFKPLLLIYIFSVRSPTMEMSDQGRLNPEDLLIPPIMTNRLPWIRGYFQTLGHRDLRSGDLLQVHCFRGQPRYGLDVYYDEHSNPLPGPVSPVGEWGLHSFRSIDDQVSDALGVTRAPTR